MSRHLLAGLLFLGTTFAARLAAAYGWDALRDFTNVAVPVVCVALVIELVSLGLALLARWKRGANWTGPALVGVMVINGLLMVAALAVSFTVLIAMPILIPIFGLPPFIPALVIYLLARRFYRAERGSREL